MSFKIIVVFLFLSIFIACDQFDEGKERVISRKFEIISNSVPINCDELKNMNEKISKVKFFKNGLFFKVVSGFEIQRARQCPKLYFDIKKEKVHLVVSLKESQSSIKCKLIERKVVCNKNYAAKRENK
tara:strand:+ start:3677 stop:4060 length:384 start_codon:yes stop_codon:yes gene_type:complete